MRNLLSSPTRSRPRRLRANRARRVSLERLEGRELLTMISVSDASLNEIGVPTAFVAPGTGGLSSPKDMTLGPDGNLYVVNGDNSVLRYNGTTGALIGTFVAAGSGGLNTPYGLAFGPDGNLYVSSRGTSNAVLRYNGTTGAFIDAFVSTGSGGLNSPAGVTFGADGNLYVVSNGSSSVLRFEGPLGGAPGSPLPSTGQTGATFVAVGSGGLAHPADLAFGPDGNLYVSSQNTDAAVLKFDGTSGSFLSTYVAPGAGGLVTPRGLAFDQDGRLYVADVGNDAIHRYDGTGQYLDDPVAGATDSLGAPIGIVFDAQGDLLISNRGANSIGRYDRGVVVTLDAATASSVSVGYATADGTATAPGDYTAQAGTVTFAPGQTARTVLLVTHEEPAQDGNETFAVQLNNSTGGATIGTGTGTVTIVDPARQLSVTNASAIEGDHTAQYRGAFVVAPPSINLGDAVVFNGGYFYTSPGPDTVDPIDRYDATTGAFIDHFIPAGRINGVRTPVFHNGYLYVGSEYTDEVLRYDAVAGAPAGVSGLPGDPVFVSAGSGGLDGPWGLCFGPDGNLYVTGRNSFNVIRYDGTTGQPLGSLNTSGSGALSWPEGLTIDSTGTVYVASSGATQIQKYNEATGAYLGAVSSPALAGPSCVKIGPDGLLYVVSPGNSRILRFTTGGSYVDDYVPAGGGGMTDPLNMNFGPDGDLYVAGLQGDNKVYRFGTENEAVFAVSVSTPSTLPLSLSYATGSATDTAVAGRDYTATSGTLTLAPGTITATVRVPILDDGAVEPGLSLTLNLSSSETTPSQVQGVATITDSNANAKFAVVNDATSSLGGTNTVFKYQASGTEQAPYGLSLSDLDPRGIASNSAGTTQWVIDANKNVYVYSTAGTLLGSWSAGGLSSSAKLTGIATNGTDIWLVDSYTDKVYKYTGAASRISGSQSASSSFSLVGGRNGDTNPQDIVTDGTSFWVVDGTRLKVFKYTLTGSSLGSWAIDPADTHPTGITINPSNVSDVWIVDSGTDKVYQYIGAASRTSGSQTAGATFALAAGDTNPQGIADPPTAAATPNPVLSPRSPTAASTWTGGVQKPSILIPWSPSNDQDLTLLASELIAAGTRRGRTAQRS